MATTLTPNPKMVQADTLVPTPPGPPAISSPPWPAAAASLIAYAALALSSGAVVPLVCLGVALLASYPIRARYENQTLTKWTLRIVVIGGAVFGYLVNAGKTDSVFGDMRWGYSAALAAASELALQFWRREPTGGARAPLTALLSPLVFLAGCSTFDDSYHYIWYLAPAFFLFFALALPNFRPQTAIPASLTLVPVLIALSLGAATHAGFTIYRGDLNALGSHFLSGRNTSVSMGMSGQPLLGSSFTLRDSLTRALRVQNLGDDPYLRGMTFDTYSGRSWNPALEQRTFKPYRLSRGSGGAGKSMARVVRLDDANWVSFSRPCTAPLLRPKADTHWNGPARPPGL